MPKRWLFLLLFLISLTHLQAQKHLIQFENITIDDGLAQSTITDLLQDKNGFMWFATAEGLHRYDGYSFKIFKSEQGNEHSLSDNYLTALAQDKIGNIYIGANNGSLCKLDIATGQFIRLNNNWNGGNNFYPINHLNIDANNQIWIATEGGGAILIDSSGKVLRLLNNQNNTLANNYIRKTVLLTNRTLVCTQNGLIALDNHFKPQIVSELDSFHLQFVTDVLAINNNQYYVSTMGQGLYLWDTNKKIVTKIELPRMRGSRHLEFLLQDDDKDLWIGTSNGGLLRIIDNQVYTYSNNPLISSSLVGDDVNGGIIDRNGNIWFGTISGISKFDKSLRSFGLFKEFTFNGEVLNNNVYSIYEDKRQNLWLGTLTGGLMRYNVKADSIDQYYPYIKVGKVETKAVRCIYEDNQGHLWIGTRDQGLFELDRDKKQFIQHTGKPGHTITHPVIRAIFEDSKNRLWIGTGNGLNLYNTVTQEFTPFRGDPNSPSNNQIYDIKEDPASGKILAVAFRGGLQVIEANLKSIKNYRHNNTNKGPSSDNVMCILNMGKGKFMLGTYGGGISIFDIKADTFGFITEQNGLVNNVVYGILPGLKDEYWLSTNRGICKINLDKNTFKSFGLNHYIQSYEYNEGAFCKTHNGLLFFGGIKGINYFDPEKLKLLNKPYNVVLISFRLMDKSGSIEKDITHSTQLEIPYNANLISFDFAALGYSNLKEIKYAYKLEGYDKDWIECGNRRTAYYTRLSPGNYTFKVKVFDNTGEWQKEGKSIKIHVPPPFWLSTWFLVLMVLVAIAIIARIIQIRTKIISKRFKQRQVELELSALRSQMNPHFIFNSLNSIQYYILQKEPKAAYTYLTKFSTLMRMILQNSRQRFISLTAEKEWLLLYLELEKLRMENELDYSIFIADEINANGIMVPTMLVQPYVENAIIHGLLPKEKDRQLKIRFSIANNLLHVEIEDNGIGRIESEILNAKRNKKHSSSGMKITQERLEILGFEHGTSPKLEIRDLAQGTMVLVDLPIIYKQNNE
jgi:ligand-binding sensor domain-containing protein